MSDSREEVIIQSYERWRAAVEAALLERLFSILPSSFEQLIVEVLKKLGYGPAGKAVGRSGDKGIDGVIYEDRLGFGAIYVQAKQWKKTVGRPEVQAFAGAVLGKGGKKGVMVTTSKFSKHAHDYVEALKVKIILIDGEELVKLMFDVDLGVSATGTLPLKRIDDRFFLRWE